MYPKVSAVILAGKNAGFLTRAVDSVLEQTYANIEVVIVDNDDFCEKNGGIAEKYENDPRVTFIPTNPDIGGGKARNIGIMQCGGDYVAFLGERDEFTPPRIESQLKFMMMHNLDFSFTDVDFYDKNGKFIRRQTRSDISGWSAEELYNYHIEFSVSPTPAFMAKKDFLIETGGFRDIESAQDFMLMLDALEYAKLHPEKRFGYLPCSYLKSYDVEDDRSAIEDRICSENSVYKIKTSGQDKLGEKELRYIDFRHYQTLAGNYRKLKDTKNFLSNSFKSFMTSPELFFKYSIRR